MRWNRVEQPLNILMPKLNVSDIELELTNGHEIIRMGG
jgi:hypothetical protein